MFPWQSGGPGTISQLLRLQRRPLGNRCSAPAFCCCCWSGTISARKKTTISIHWYRSRRGITRRDTWRPSGAQLIHQNAEERYSALLRRQDFFAQANGFTSISFFFLSFLLFFQKEVGDPFTSLFFSEWKRTGATRLDKIILSGISGPHWLSLPEEHFILN